MSEHFAAFADHYPVTLLHTLIIPKEHRETFFDLSPSWSEDLFQFMQKMKHHLEGQDSTIRGWNIGMNCGNVAGQTVFHCHIHMIPRRSGDVSDPRGGVRGVIADKQKYGD